MGVAAPIPSASMIFRGDETHVQLPDDFVDKLHEGYAQSKFVGERLIIAASHRGIPVRIYRPGRITGHSRTGVTSVEDFMCRFLKGCLQAGCAPELDWPLDMNPVDYVAAAV